MNPEQQQEIIDLRARNLTPKQIARKLGLKVPEVTAFLRERAQGITIARVAAGELAPVAECLVNASCADQFLNANATQDTDQPENNGLGLVVVARKEGYNRLTICSYLLDLWCLGVKDSFGPRKVDTVEYKQTVDYAYQGFTGETREITLEQAQALVFSALEYASNLGFSHHPDFERSRAHLGTWSGEPKIQCGRNGKPFYVSGPYDNPSYVLKTLQVNVGEGNFDYLTELFGE
ncbi:MAG TPA: hypothetical protein DDZ80_10720 [Cyanobacteria bacterium UBA8803]|nr:hypothetical protein [Cyanobacteria bacterium UBA9273]HBL58964.1 hypothetical protein [Cyanobacteria bacterium UBA8803]